MGKNGELFPKKEDNKRTLKSQFQLEALENFYNEHKYPSESMKLKLANNIGLSVRQVSGWFCHRRAKDKRAVNEEAFGGLKHNFSDVVHEQSTGPVQESCSSTKHENSRHFDPREVESKRTHAVTSSKEVSAFEKTQHHLISREYTSIGDVFPESSSDSEEMHPNGLEELYATGRLRCTFQKDNDKPISFKDLNSRRGVKEDGYLSMKNWNQTSSVSSVKRKLGRLYHDDGPLISSDFDPLPPGAFDTPIIEDYYVQVPMMEPHSMSGVSKSSMAYSDRDRYEMHPKKSYPEGKGFRRAMQASQFKQETTNYPRKSKLLLTNLSNHNQRQTSVLGMDEEFIMAGCDFDSKNHESHCKYNFEEKQNKPSPYLPLDNDCRGQISQKQKYFGTKHFSSTQVRSDVPDVEHNVKQRSTPKDLKFLKEYKTIRHPSSAQNRMHEKKTKMKISQRVGVDEIRRKDYILAMPCSVGLS